VSNSNRGDDEPTARLFFLERNVGPKTLNILHQVWRTPDGLEYLREVGKITHAEAKERYGYDRSNPGMRRPSTVRGERIT
jgi:aspartyl-tRNA synthetase